MNTKQLYELIICKTLKELNLYSEEAAKLVLFTCAQESSLGKYVKQIKGVALGIFQCEPVTHKDVIVNFLNYNNDLKRLVAAVSMIPLELVGHDELLIFNLRYATCICRLHYLRVPSAIPKDQGEMAKYWKKHYNTPLGRGTVEQFSARAGRLWLAM